MKLKVGKAYEFGVLEALLSEAKFTTMVRVFDMGNKQFAIMAVFHENFCGDWLSGDAVLFYDDNETHTADQHAMFLLEEIIPVNPTHKQIK